MGKKVFFAKVKLGLCTRCPLVNDEKGKTTAQRRGQQ